MGINSVTLKYHFTVFLIGCRFVGKIGPTYLNKALGLVQRRKSDYGGR